MKQSFLVLQLCMLTGCASAYLKQVGGDLDHAYYKTFITEYDVAWDSVVDALKSEQLEILNKDSGVIQTKWGDNTSAMNASESFQGARAFVKAEYRMKVNLTKTFFEGVPAVKVMVRKDQLLQQDVLDQIRLVETNGIDEHTLLYRTGRLIAVKTKMDQHIREEKEAALEAEKATAATEVKKK